VPGEHDVHFQVEEREQEIAGVLDDVALAAGARDRDQVVVDSDDLEVVCVGELFPDPGVAVPADAALVEVRFGRVQADDRDAGRLEPLRPDGVQLDAQT
jgi:hypothetical protein